MAIEQKRRIFSTLRRHKSLNVILEGSEASRTNSYVHTDKIPEPYHSLKMGKGGPESPLWSAHSQHQQIECKQRASGSNHVPTAISQQQARLLQPKNVAEKTATLCATPTRSRSKTVRKEIYRAISSIRRKKTNQEDISQKEKMVTRMQLDCGSTFNLSSIVDKARQVNDQQELIDFLQPIVNTGKSQHREAAVESTARDSSVDLSCTDWDVKRFYDGDLATKEIYSVERKPPADYAEAGSSCEFFGTYRRPLRYGDTGPSQELWETPLLQTSWSYPLGDAVPVLALGQTQFASPVKNVVGTSSQPSNDTNQEERTALANSEPDESGDAPDEASTGWTGTLLEQARALAKLNTDAEVPPSGKSGIRCDSVEGCGAVAATKAAKKDRYEGQWRAGNLESWDSDEPIDTLKI